METYSLVGDVGGTNARFALVRQGGHELEHLRVLQVKDHANLDTAVKSYLLQLKQENLLQDSVAEACCAFAGPVHGDQVKLTNSHWSFSKQAMARQLSLRSFKTINDFTAMALGVPHVADAELASVGEGEAESGLPKLVIGPGTGLGVAGLLNVEGRWLPIASEGGHVDFAPTTDLEIEILRMLRSRFGRVSAERILCGEGLVSLYQCLAELEGVAIRLATPKEVLDEALAAPDSIARQVLHLFCEVLGRTAGNAALTFGALGGVYICGGIVPRFVEFFKRSRFRKAFEDKGRMAPLMNRIPTFVVTDAFTGLRGAAEALSNPRV